MGPIKDVKKLSPKRQPMVFSDRGGLLQADIELIDTWPARNESSKIAPRARRRNRKGGPVQPVVDRLIPRINS